MSPAEAENSTNLFVSTMFQKFQAKFETLATSVSSFKTACRLGMRSNNSADSQGGAEQAKLPTNVESVLVLCPTKAGQEYEFSAEIENSIADAYVDMSQTEIPMMAPDESIEFQINTPINLADAVKSGNANPNQLFASFQDAGLTFAQSSV